jgi:hypothetical protein
VVSWNVLGRWYAYLGEDRTHMITFDFNINEMGLCEGGGMHTWVRIGDDRTHMITFDFDLNGTIIKWGCVGNIILKNAAHSETEEEKKNYST